MKFLPITWRLKLLAKMTEPRREFEVALRAKFAPSDYKPRGAFLRQAFVVASVVVMAGMGTATYAYASDDVVPEHPLYPLRQSIETFEGSFAITPKLKERVERRFLERKVREIEMIKKRVPQIENKPAGEALSRIQSVMKQGLESKTPMPKIKDEILKEVRTAKIKVADPRFRRQLNIIELQLSTPKIPPIKPPLPQD